jgi:tRNA(His) 5'-end guanylyltransferase
VAEPTLLGMTAHEEHPIFYSYRSREVRFGVSSDRPSVELFGFNFSMRVPVSMGNSVQYEPVGFDTSVSLRDKEKVVIGTTTMRDKALIVVLTASTEPKP